MSDLDALLGRWHALADRPFGEIEEQFNPDSEGLVADIVHKVLGASGNHKFESANEFAQYVSELRENERSWSRRLAEVILRAQGLSETGHGAMAAQVFQEFESDCPWLFFVTIARTQRDNTLS